MMGSKAFALVFPLFLAQMSAPSYRKEIEHWRQARVAALKADGSWLTVTGLFWLKPGRNTVGAGPANDIVLPKASAPDAVGEFDFENGQTSFRAAQGAEVTIDGKPAASAALKSDATGSPDVVRINALTMLLIQRGDRFGIRLKDNNSELRRKFTAIKYFPIRESYRVVARFVPYTPPRKITIPNILGQIETDDCPGYVEFTLNGRKLRLDPLPEGDEFFFVFKDLTSEKETYPPGRFLYTSTPKNGEVVLDFNKAYNPPCAFTPYATCPLPPKENILPVRIEAGELRYGH